MAGDFNANVRWDSSGKYPPFRDVNSLLESMGFKSAYHSSYREQLGEESRSTLFWQRNPKKPYHVDYCYCTTAGESVSINVELGSPEEWIKLGDHAPMVVTIDGW